MTSQACEIQALHSHHVILELLTNNQNNEYW